MKFGSWRCLNKIFSDSLFDDLETEYLQDKFIEENMGYVEPLSVKLGTINKQVKKMMFTGLILYC
jgi:hypothetical protein